MLWRFNLLDGCKQTISNKTSTQWIKNQEHGSCIEVIPNALDSKTKYWLFNLFMKIENIAVFNIGTIPPPKKRRH